MLTAGSNIDHNGIGSCSMFYQDKRESNIDLHIFNDSSGIANIGYAWCMVLFMCEFHVLKDLRFNCCELFAVVVAASYIWFSLDCQETAALL